MPGDALIIGPDLAIPDAEIVERFVRASGAGGQNVNKVSTAVELRFDIAQSPSLPEAVRTRLLAKRDRRVTDDMEVAWERAYHVLGDATVESIKPYPCGPEPDHHDHYRPYGTGTAREVIRILGPESECDECTEPDETEAAR